MVRIETGAPAQGVKQSAQHVLFVEGRTDDGLDVTVLKELLAPQLAVKPLGASFSVRSAAKALHPHNPGYWFVIDRDDWDETVVEHSWQNFPDPTADNLLIWRRKELESYFLEPGWVCKSRYLKPDVTEQTLQHWLATEAANDLWATAANRVIIALRNQVKRRPAPLLKPGPLSRCSQQDALQALLTSEALQALNNPLSTVTEEAVEQHFYQECERLTGGTVPLTWGCGAWLALMPAKTLFRRMVNQWLAVPDLSGQTTYLTGRQAERAVAVDLLKNHAQAMPEDFVQLKAMLARSMT